MSLASTNPHQMLRAGTAVSPVALLQSSCGSDTQSWDSMQISAPGCRCDELYFEKNQNVVIVTCCTGHGRGCTGVH